MLDAFDVLVFDIQDVGARFYTYLYSLGYAMEACDRAGKSMVVLDRLNPIGGLKTGGTVLNPAFKSFVGDYELPTQYGLTIGEAARYIRDYQKLTLDLTVIPLEGWEPGHVSGRHRPAVGGSVSQLRHAERRPVLHRHLRVRGHQPERGPGHHPALRGHRRSLH